MKHFKIFLLLLALVFATTSLAAWSEPTCAPPGCNTDEPLNVGSSPQPKTGLLSLNTLLVSIGARFLPGSGIAGKYLKAVDDGGNLMWDTPAGGPAGIGWADDSPTNPGGIANTNSGLVRINSQGQSTGLRIGVGNPFNFDIWRNSGSGHLTFSSSQGAGYFFDNNVGIGQAPSPSYKFLVNGSIYASGNAYFGNNNLSVDTSGNLVTNGTIGIGTATPLSQLEVRGPANVITLNSTLARSSSYGWLRFRDSAGDKGYVGYGSAGGSTLYVANEIGGTVNVSPSLTTQTLCLSGDCRSAWPSGGSGGGPVSIPAGMIAMFRGGCPGGWSLDPGFSGKVPAGGVSNVRTGVVNDAVPASGPVFWVGISKVELGLPTPPLSVTNHTHNVTTESVSFCVKN